MYPGVGTFVLIRPAQTFYERIMYFYLLPDVNDVGGHIDDVRWSALLKSASAFEMYRQRFGPIAPERVAEFLILDREFPRSMNSCIINADESLHAISSSPTGSWSNSAEESLYGLRVHLDGTDIDQVMVEGLHEFLEGFQKDLNDIGQYIFDTYFALPIVTTSPADGSGETTTQTEGS